MKRVIAAIAALLLAASAAEARDVLVTSQRLFNAAGSNNYRTETYRAQEAKHITMVLALLDKFGVDYAYVPPEAMRTEFARTGTMVWQYGTAGAYTEQFNSVITINFLGKLGSTTPFWHPESLGFSATVTGTAASHGRGVPAVPNLFIAAQTGEAGAGVWQTNLRDSTGKDSLGISTAGSRDTRTGWTTCQLVTSNRLEGTTTPWWGTGFNAGITPNPTPPAGGWRALVRNSGNTASSLYFYEADGTPGSNTAAWLDSMEFTASLNGLGTDTVQVFERPMSHITGARPIVVVYPYGTSSCAGDTVGSNRYPCEYDIPSVALCIARLDSLTGGGVIKKPMQAAVVLTGAFARRGPNFLGAGGINPADTSNVWVAIDSTATLRNIKWTIGGNPDSAKTYASEIAQWKKLPNVRWTPWSLRGLSDTTKAGGYGADPWGRYRNRPVAVGPYVASDTSLSTLLRFNADSLCRVVNGARSYTAVAPFDDWTPKNTRPFANGSGSLPVDSVLYAVTQAQFSALVYNAQLPFTFNTMMGYKVTQQGQYGSRLGSGTPFTISMLGHTGMAIRGSAFQQDMRQDSVLTPGSSNNCNALTGISTTNLIMSAAYENHRWWYGLTVRKYRDYDFMCPWKFDAWDGVNTPLEDVLYDLKSASIIRVSASDFGSGGHPRPTRPGYWALKSLYNSFQAINQVAGRTVCQFVWPEDLQP